MLENQSKCHIGRELLNAKKAAETITGNGLTSWVSEENLADHQKL